MKKRTIYFILIAILFCTKIQAQYGNGGYGGGYGAGGYGGNRNGSQFDRNNASQQNQEKQKPKLEDVAKRVDAIVEKLKKELTLDDLQVFAVNKYMTTNINDCDKIILKESTSQDEKITEIMKVNDTSDFNIISILNKYQKVKYKTMVDERKAKFQAYQDRK